MLPPRKILAIKLRSLGDTVLMTAPLAELHRAFPNTEIHALVSRAWAPLLEHHPAVHRILTYERHRDTASRTRALVRTALTLRKTGYDWVLGFHASPSSATLAYATGAPLRSIHFHGHRNRNRFSTVVVPGKGILKPVIERDMDTVRATGLPVPPGLLPRIHLLSSEREEAHRRIVKLGLAGPVLGLGLGASRPTKAWATDRYAMLAVDWILRTGGSVLAVVGPQESLVANGFFRAVDDALISRVPEVSSRVGVREKIACENSLSLRSLAAALSEVAVFVGNDSGPRHLALAVGVRTVTLFGPEDPFEWHPYPQDLHPFLFVEGLACRDDADPGMPPWCGLEVCIEQRHQCMGRIGVDEVLKLALKAIQL